MSSLMYSVSSTLHNYSWLSDGKGHKRISWDSIDNVGSASGSWLTYSIVKCIRNKCKTVLSYLLLGLKSWIKEARQNFGCFPFIWRYFQISTNFKLKIFRSNVNSVLFYHTKPECPMRRWIIVHGQFLFCNWLQD